MEFFKGEKRDSGLSPWGEWVPTRTDNSERGKAIPFDGFIGFDGIPVSFEGGDKAQGNKGGRKTFMIGKKVKNYPISACYIGVLILVGVIWQWII